MILVIVFFKGSDLGKMVVLPFYQQQRIEHLDAIVISHPDKDHNGGLKSIAAALPVGQLLVNDPHYYNEGINCHEAPPWQWDGVTFRFFPIHDTFPEKNNNSCILQIATQHQQILLTGDIETKAEEYLIKNYGQELKSSFLLIPHHGSKTSSSLSFLNHVAPYYAIASLGFANRFHFPHQQIEQRLKDFNDSFFANG